MKENKKRIIFIAGILVILVFVVADGLDYIKINKSAKSGSASEKAIGKKVEILFLGDLMFDRYIRQVAQKKGNDFIFQNVATVLVGHDLVVANLEGPITDNPSISLTSKIGERNNYYFTFDRDVADTLRKYGIGLVNLGNNHILNFGERGLDQTEQFLDTARVNYFGDYRGNGKRFFAKEINGVRIGFVNYNQFTANGSENVLDDIVAARKESDFVVVYAHWGTEYVTSPDDKIRNLAHEFIDKGAGLIIGSHPHVIQSNEEYRGKKIYYSLGNFIFDQYAEKNTTIGLGVVFDLDYPAMTTKFTEISLQMQSNGQTKLGTN